MNAILGTIKNGQIVANVPANWPDGCQVVIEPVTTARGDTEENGWLLTPEAIAQRLALMDRIEPLELTPQEEAEWAAARKGRKEDEKATFERRADDLKRMWE